jgi:hypothetical protein
MKGKFFFVSIMAAALLLGGVALSIADDYNLPPQMYDEGKYREGTPKFIEQYGPGEDNPWPVPLEDKKGGLPFWVRNWNYWAEELGNEEWIAWGKRLADPRAIELGKQWIEITGGLDCSKITARSKVAPDIKPGVVITADNWKKYPGFLKVWPESLTDRITKGAYMRYGKIKIAPTQHQYYSKGYLHYTKKYLGKSKMNEEGMMALAKDNFVAGIPYPVIKKWGEYDELTPWRILQNFDRLVVGQDQLSFNPIILTQYDRKGDLERTIKMGLYWRIYWGRVDVPPTPFIIGQEDSESKGSIAVNYPFDVRGFAATRWRYTDVNKADLFMCYLPALRRTRRLSGADTQDPILGSELTWEDWKVWWQKISQEIWPSECKILREEEFLTPLRWDTRFKAEDGIISAYFERRPSWVMDYIAIKGSDYFYKIRRSWIDFEEKRCNYDECYDQRGRFWRSWLDYNRWFPEGGFWTWWGCDIPDHVNKHRTILQMEAQVNDPKITDSYYDLRFLSRLAH